MEFDKRTIIAFILIGLILILIQTDYYQKRFGYQPVPPATGVADTTFEAETRETEQEPAAGVLPEAAQAMTAPERAAELEREKAPYDSLQGEGEPVTVETDYYTAVFSTRGATLRKWILKKYVTHDGRPVQLVGEDGEGNLSVLLPTEEDTLDTSPFVFSVNSKRLVLKESDRSAELIFTLDLGGGQRIEKRFRFYSGRYDIDYSVRLFNLGELVDGFSYFIAWRTGLASTEPDFKQDMSRAEAYVHQGEEESFAINDEYAEEYFDDPTDWVAIRTKYFATAFIVQSEVKGQAAKLFGEPVDIGEEVPWRKYGYELKMPFVGERRQEDRFTVFLGPLDYDIITSYNVGLEKIMDLGWALFRPIGKFVLWFFELLHNFIPNYGFVIIVFSIFIKIVLYPLTRKSFQSMKEMQALQPLMAEINEKYKNDPQRKQQEIMKLYKEHGVNPLGGCIPMLVQFPLLIALFQIFQSTIELRQAPFIFWITDLSRPDTIADIPTILPFNNLMYGNHVNILPLFMGVTMFIQQKMSMKDPKQKAMVYFMPILFTLLFNSFPSGLNLYYAMFNLLTIIQEKVIPYKPRKPEELKRSRAAKVRRKHDYRKRI